LWKTTIESRAPLARDRVERRAANFTTDGLKSQSRKAEEFLSPIFSSTALEIAANQFARLAYLLASSRRLYLCRIVPDLGGKRDRFPARSRSSSGAHREAIPIESRVTLASRRSVQRSRIAAIPFRR